jgi:hypothetical protein
MRPDETVMFGLYFPSSKNRSSSRSWNLSLSLADSFAPPKMTGVALGWGKVIHTFLRHDMTRMRDRRRHHPQRGSRENCSHRARLHPFRFVYCRAKPAGRKAIPETDAAVLSEPRRQLDGPVSEAVREFLSVLVRRVANEQSDTERRDSMVRLREAV